MSLALIPVGGSATRTYSCPLTLLSFVEDRLQELGYSLADRAEFWDAELAGLRAGQIPSPDELGDWSAEELLDVSWDYLLGLAGWPPSRDIIGRPLPSGAVQLGNFRVWPSVVLGDGTVINPGSFMDLDSGSAQLHTDSRPRTGA